MANDSRPGIEARAVGLVTDDDNVMAITQPREGLLPRIKGRLLHGGTDDSATGTVVRQLPQLLAGFRLPGLLPQEIPGAYENARQLARPGLDGP